jgi:hypothetical protein
MTPITFSYALFVAFCCCHVRQESPPAATANHMFVPRPLEPFQVDKLTVKLYPIVDSSVKPPKNTHAFQTNKTALSAPGIDRRAMLDTLSAQLNLSAIVGGVLGDWNRHFRCNWCNFQHLTILSYHSSAGTQVNDTSDASDLAILSHIINDGFLQASLFCPSSTQPRLCKPSSSRCPWTHHPESRVLH